MDDLITKLFLLSGKPLCATASVCVEHPVVSQVMNINSGVLCEDYYWSYVYAILSDPYDHMVYLDDKGLDYESVSSFTTFGLRWVDACESARFKNDDSALRIMTGALNFFLGEHDYDFTVINNAMYLTDKNNPLWVINEEIFELITKFIEKLSCVHRENKIKPATKAAKMILIDDARRELKRKKKLKVKEDHQEPIADAVIALVASTGMARRSDYEDIPIYQLLVASQAAQKKVVVQSMLNGIYTGMLKTDKLPDEDLRWI